MAKPKIKPVKAVKAETINDESITPEVDKFIARHSDHINAVTAFIAAIALMLVALYASYMLLSNVPIIFPLATTSAALIYLATTFYRLCNSNKQKEEDNS